MNQRQLIEAYLYQERIGAERLHPTLEAQLKENKTSLGDHPAFPATSSYNFATELVGERFSNVIDECKMAYGVDKLNPKELVMGITPMIMETIDMERPNRNMLEEMAEHLVKEEFGIDDEVAFDIKLVDPTEIPNTTNDGHHAMLETEFTDHAEIELANDNIYKRRMLSAMVEGSANVISHMFHLAEGDLARLNPKLLNQYKRLMAANNFLSFMVDMDSTGMDGGIVDVEFGGERGDIAPPTVHVRAITFPVLIQETVKGVMQILAAHGLPEEQHIAEYVISKADGKQTESWDKMIGVPIWERFCAAIPSEDSGLKHHIFVEIASLPPNEFNECMKEVLAKTKRGNQLIGEILSEVKRELKEDEFNEAMGDNYFSINELLG